MVAATRQYALKRLKPVRGRVARPAGFRYNYAKTLAQTASMWLFFFGALPAATYRIESQLKLARFRFAYPFWKRVAAAGFLSGAALALISAVFMVAKGEGTPLPADAPRKLVVAGPYRCVRNPMAMGSFAQGIAVGLWLGSPLVTLYALLGTVGWDLVVRPWEELDLERRFGEPFSRYRENVRCWVPRLTPYRTEAEQERSPGSRDPVLVSS
jgi:protein-S-isoprenylcysteine O-methyltransferase Ste14